MSRQILILFSLLMPAIPGFAQTEILRHFDPNNSSFLYPSGFNLLVSRFEPEAPGKIKKISIKLGGTAANGSVEMTLFGHEGGTAFPQLEMPLFDWVTLNKTVVGEEWISYDLPSAVESVNNQFFVVFRNLKNGARLYADNKGPVASCKSGSGGDYYFLFLKTTSNNWSTGSKNAFAVEVEMEYARRKGKPFFTDVTSAAGLDTNLGNSAIAWADVNKDGYQDLLTQNRFYINEHGVSFSDQTDHIGLKGSNGAMFVDIDNDGDLDILAFFPSGDSALFFKNDGGLNFTKVKATGMKSLPSLSSFSAADLDGDGFPEIFVGQLWGAYPEPFPNYLFKNHGNGVFTDITNKLYPTHNGTSNFPEKVICTAASQNTWLSNGNTNRRSRGSAFVDYDNDGDMDLYVTNYFLEPDEFHRNNGDGTFTDVIAEKGIDRNKSSNNHGTGVDFGDYNNDGNFDLLLPQFSHPAFAVLYDHRNTTIYRNTGGPNFDFEDLNDSNEMINPTSGIQYEETYAGGSWGDINNDGLPDFYMSVFYGCRYVKLYLQKPDHTFDLQTYYYGLQNLNTGEDATWVDYNNDGLLDLCSGDAGRIRLFKNEGKKDGDYLTLELKASKGNLFAIGSRVIVHSGGRKITQQINAGRGVRHQRPYRLHFGLGTNSIEKVEVYWPDGSTDSYFGLLSNRHYSIEQGKPVHGLSDAASELLVFGNPGSEARVSFITREAGSLQISLMDITGRVVRNVSDEQIAPGAKNFIISGSDLTSGVYFIQAVFNKKSFSMKWVYMP